MGVVMSGKKDWDNLVSRRLPVFFTIYQVKIKITQIADFVVRVLIDTSNYHIFVFLFKILRKVDSTIVFS